MQISGETMIFRKERESASGKWYAYSTGVSSKRQDGSWINGYLDVKFRKGVEVENKTKINIKNGFLSAKEFKTGSGETGKRLELVILEFDVVDAPNSGFTAMTNDDVPF